MPVVAVSSPSFAKSAELCELLAAACPKWSVQLLPAASQELKGEALRFFLREASVALIGKELITEELLRSLPRLRCISKYGVGLDNIDFAACARHGVQVFHQPGVNRTAVAEFTLGLMLAVLRNLAHAADLMRRGVWEKDGGTQLSGKTVGIIGCGAVGEQVARLLKAFSCPLLFCDIRDLKPLCHELGAQQLPLGDLLARADVITVHVPLDSSTRSLISTEALSRCKPSSILINTSRGEVVEEQALRQALRQGRLAGAGLDVFQQEPYLDLGSWDEARVVGTPHIAGNAREAVLAMGKAAISGVAAYYEAFYAPP